MLIHRFFSLSLVVFFILWHSSSGGFTTSNIKVSVAVSSGHGQNFDGSNSDVMRSGWEDLSWYYISVRIGLFLWVALLNLITISSTWARVIDVMDSEVRDYLGLLVRVLHLVSCSGPCLLLEWLGWDLFCS